MSQNIAEIHKELQIIVKELKYLRKQKGKITAEWVDYTKNPLMGYVILWGEESLRTLGKPRAEWDDNMDGWKQYYRECYFKDIRYRSKLRRIRDRIGDLEQRYNKKLNTLKNIVSSEPAY